MFADLFDRHYAQPQGLVGQIAGMRMAYQHRPENHWTLAVLDARAGDSVLEIGFGPGIAIKQLARQIRTGWIAGVDASATMLAAAGRRNARAVRQGLVELYCADAAELPFDDMQFDRAFSIHSIYFWREPLRALQEIWRVLHPGGLLALTILPRELWGDGAGIEPVGTPTCRPYSGDELMDLLQEAGFGRLHILADANNPAHKSNYSVIGYKQL
jgi:ubiquinone/menaquinone biosynthesis C-methylase UbiE